MSTIDAKKTAVEIRKILKTKFTKTKFSVRVPYFGTIYITWDQGPDHHAIRSITDNFQVGNFNGMEDCYEKKKNYSHAFGAQYIILTRHA
jgi:hypothetical protein